MLGAVIGDMVGKPFEFNPTKKKDFPLFSKKSAFTDDTVCTVAIADWLLSDREGDPAAWLRKYTRKYPYRGYGAYFKKWASSDDAPAYGSWGNGSAMRVSSVAYVGKNIDEVLDLAERSAMPTHGHPNAVRGAQATATAIFAARLGVSREDIRDEIRDRFGYPLNRTVDEIRPKYTFYVDCQRTVPPAIICALDSGSYEETLRNAISLGGDADTLAAIAGSIAEPLYGIPEEIASEGISRLDRDIVDVIVRLGKQVLG